MAGWLTRRASQAFGDTDGPFGSLGSFYEFFPSEGSFQINPPFMSTHTEEVARCV